MSITAPLEPYIRRALDIPTSVIFTPSNHVRTPTLHKDRVNRILIFCGSFNPPHRGHKEALCHAFFRSGTDLNIIAAFIVTLSEESVKFKQLRRSRNDIPIVFTKEQKLELWNTSGLYGGWHWCYPGRKLGCRREFLRISKEAAKDGFEIQFIKLYGEDLIDRDDIDLRGKFLVCGAGDPERSSIRDELSDVGIKPVNHFTQWQKLGMDRDLPWQPGTAGNAQWMEMILIMLYPDKAKDLPIEPSTRLARVKFLLRSCTMRLGHIRMCLSKQNDYSWIRFVPTSFLGMTGGAEFLGDNKTLAMSSSLMLKIIRAAQTKSELWTQLKDLALNPELMLQYLEVIYPQHPAFQNTRRVIG